MIIYVNTNLSHKLITIWKQERSILHFVIITEVPRYLIINKNIIIIIIIILIASKKKKLMRNKQMNKKKKKSEFTHLHGNI